MADTNLVCLSLGTLAKDADEMMTGDPIRCKGCDVILNGKSILLREGNNNDRRFPKSVKFFSLSLLGNDEGVFSWTCEFCSTFNELNLEEGEIPTKFQSEYMLVPPTKSQQKQLTIFCIDISGSM